MFDTLPEQPADALLALIGLYRADPRPQKLDLGVGVYRDDSGVTPIMAAVKAAEKVLLETRTTKAYLGPEGDPVYTDLLKSIVFGKDPGRRVAGIQTPGGTGAVRLAADLVALARPDAKILYGAPTWPNHLQILNATRLKAVSHPYFDVKTQTLNVASLVAAIEGASAGDVVLLHGCCHNPTGGELEPADWQTVLKALQETGVVPLVDFAYHGLGKGLEGDAYGVRLLMDNLDEVMVAYSCDKNFGLYRDRVGALYVKARDERAASAVMSNLAAFGRVSLVDAAGSRGGHRPHHSGRRPTDAHLARRDRPHGCPRPGSACRIGGRRIWTQGARDADRHVLDAGAGARSGAGFAQGSRRLHGRFGPHQCRRSSRPRHSGFRNGAQGGRISGRLT